MALSSHDDGGNNDNEWTITAHNTLTLKTKKEINMHKNTHEN